MPLTQKGDSIKRGKGSVRKESLELGVEGREVLCNGGVGREAEGSRTPEITHQQVITDGLNIPDASPLLHSLKL